MLVLLPVFSLCFLSCTGNKRRDNIAQVVKEWVGKEIRFAEGLDCTSMGKDIACIDLYSESYKILLYVDSVGCTSCKFNLVDWKSIMNESDTIFIQKPEFIFIFQPKKNGEKELHTVLRNNGFRHPVFVDKENQVYRINKFPSNPDYQCFLLDKDNKVVMVGNPSLIKGIWSLYKKVISENEKKVITMGKVGDCSSLKEKTDFSPIIHIIKKGGSMSMQFV